MHLVDILGIHLESTTGAPVVLLREHEAPHRYLPLFVGDTEAAAIAFAVSGHAPARPLTHDLMAQLVDQLGARVDAVEITDLREGTFIARLSVTGPTGHLALDTRPSDAIALAVRVDAPVYVDDDVLEAAGTMPQVDDGTDDTPAVELTGDAIDHEVDRFRAELDALDVLDAQELLDAFDVDDDLDDDVEPPQTDPTDPTGDA